MSREIKFRVWDKVNKKMIMYETACSCPDITLNGVLISHDKQSNVSYQYVLMQYTGLKDKNGVEIYEGDVAKQRRAGWPQGNLTGGEVKIEVSRGVTIGNWPAAFDIEIIGNIHNNPELLGEKKWQRQT